MVEIMKGLNDVVEMRKARYLGASSVSLYFVAKQSSVMMRISQMAAREFQIIQTVAEKHGWHKSISMQGF
jgi:hypothetical protein